MLESRAVDGGCKRVLLSDVLSSQSSRTLSGQKVLANESESELEFHLARTFL